MGHKYKVGDVFLYDVNGDGNTEQVEIVEQMPLPEPKYRGPDYPTYEYMVTTHDGEDLEVAEADLIEIPVDISVGLDENGKVIVYDGGKIIGRQG